MKLSVGDSCSDEVSFTQDDVIAFAKITGDHNPIHFENGFKKVGLFSRPIVHGMLAASSLSRLTGMIFPLAGSVLIKREIDFVRPVFVGEVYTMHSKVISMKTDDNTGIIRSLLKNSEGKICIRSISTIKNKNFFSV